MERMILSFSMHKSKKYFCAKYGQLWFEDFKKLSHQYFNEVRPEIPNIGTSIFSTNYQFAPAYIAWYKALRQMKLEAEEVDKEIWKLNENLMNTFPKFLLKLCGKVYLDGFQKKAMEHIERQNQGKLHPYDWKINFRAIDSNAFEIDINECAYKKLAQDFQVQSMLPEICRMDYLMANLMGNGFERTKTLGDGDNLCNCRYAKAGHCAWSPESGFTDRK